MNLFSFGAFLTTAFNLLICVFVSRKKNKSKIVRAYLAWSASVMVWSFGYGVTLAGFFSYDTTLFFNRLCQAAAFLIGPLFFNLCVCMTDNRVYKKRVSSFYLFFGALNAVVLLFTNIYVAGLWSFGQFKYQPLGGPFYFVFVLFFLLCNIHGFILVLKQFLAEQNLVKKQQHRLFLLATGIGYGLSGELFLQAFHIPIAPHGIYVMFTYLVILGHAIHKYKFLEIELIIKKTLIFAGLLAFVFGVYAVATIFIRRVLSEHFIINDFWASAISIVLIVLGYDPLRSFLINFTDKHLFQKPYDYHKVLKDASRGMSKIESLHHLMGLVLHFLTMKMRVENAAILSLVPVERHFHVLAARGYKMNYPRIALDTEHPLIQMLIATHDTVQLDDVVQSIESESNLNLNPGLKLICDEMGLFGAQCAVPSFLGDDLKNILLIGGKKSGVSYSSDDLSLLMTLAQESSIAFENARLYDEVIDRKQLLESTNKNLVDSNRKLEITQASLIVAEKNATMVGMAKAIAHEVNNPLSTVAERAKLIYTEKLSECQKILAQFDAANPAETFHSLEKSFLKIHDNAARIEKSARRIEIVVKTLTDILKDTKGEIGPLSLIILIREAREATRFVTYDENLSGCEIVEDVPGSLLIMGNLEQLLQVFINLIKNAYEAMGARPDRRIKISAQLDPENSKMVRIEVKDNGPGISPEVLKDIWKQGFSTKTKQSNEIGAVGQGQGLFICKHMIESVHSGVIFSESVMGQGTTFVIKLPVADVEG